MADNGAHVDSAAFHPEDEIDEVFSRGNPNPTRTGCPPHDVLIAAAGKKLPIGDPAYEHLGKCSPCYQEFRRIQQSQRQTVRRSLSVRAASLAVAAAIVLIVAGALWLLRTGQPTVAPSPSSTPLTVTAVAQPLQVDLRNYSVSRTDQQGPRREPVRLRRASLNLTILLPVGSEAGHYDLQVLDSGLRSRASATGQAEIKNFVTTLQATMDLRSLAPGAYQLALRHDGDDWRLFPALVQ